MQLADGSSDPGEIRTPDQQLRRLLLYPLSYGAGAEKYRALAELPIEVVDKERALRACFR